MMPLERTGAFTFVCVAASLIVVLLMALLYKIEERIETGAPAAPVLTQGQLTTDTFKCSRDLESADRGLTLGATSAIRRVRRLDASRGLEIAFSLDRNGRMIASTVLHSSGSSCSMRKRSHWFSVPNPFRHRRGRCRAKT
jgi:hypothetical protein